MKSQGMQEEESSPTRLAVETWATGAMILLLTLACSLRWSHHKLFWSDELFDYYMDMKPTIGGMLHDQLHHPFSMEPLGFHVLQHFALKLFPRSPELGARLVSMASLLITQLCVFRITHRLIQKQRAALFAMILPLCFVTSNYAVEGRVYSFLTALVAIALVSYQAAVLEQGRVRVLALWGLFAALAVAMLSHYYAIFLPVPIVLAEGFRMVRNRRIDWHIWLALGAGFAVFAFNIPFTRPLQELAQHFYNNGETNWGNIPFTYMWFFAHFSAYFPPSNVRRPLTWLTLLIVVGLIVCAWRRWFRGADRDGRTPAFLAVLGGALFPFEILLIARFLTHAHAYQPRYSLPAIVCLSVLLGVLIEPWLRKQSVFFAVMALMFAASGLYTLRLTHQDAEKTAALTSEARVSNDLVKALAGQPEQKVYTQDVAKFLTTHFYLPAGDKHVIAGVESGEREIFWLHRMSSSFPTRGLRLTTDLPIVRYEDVARKPEPHLFVVYDDPMEEWIGKELSSGIAIAEPRGEAFGGKLYSVTFLPVK